jgi:hypothetical protein
MRKGIIVLLAIIFLSLLALMLFFAVTGSFMMIVPVILLIGLIIWLSLSFKSIEPNKMAVLVLFSKPISYLGSGIHFLPRLPKCYLEKFSTETFNVDYPPIKVMSMAGTYNGDGINYGAQIITVTVSGYINFPQDSNLIRILKNKIPTNTVGLMNWSKEVVDKATRAVLSQMTWKEAQVEKEKAQEKIKETLLIPGAVFPKNGFHDDNLTFVIPEVRLPPKIEEAMSKVDEWRIAKEAAPYEAEQRSMETTGAAMSSFSKITGLSLEKIYEELQKDPQAFVKKYQGPWDKSWGITEMEMSIDGKAYVKIDATGSSGDGGTNLLQVIAAMLRMPQGQFSKEPSDPGAKNNNGEKKNKKKKSNFKTQEEVEKGLNELGEELRERRASGWSSSGEDNAEEEDED